MLRRSIPLLARQHKTFQKQQFFPSEPLTLVSTFPGSPSMPPKAVFKTRPSMTKHEIKEYLTKIYNLPVVKVNTMNVIERRRLEANGATGRRVVKTPAWKKAIVRFRRWEGDEGKAVDQVAEVVDES